MEKEKRYLKIDNQDFHTRIKKDADGRKFLVGYGSVFNQRSKIINEYVPSEMEYRTFFEVIEPQAFDEVLRGNPDVVVSVDHDFTKLLGRTKSGTAILSIDEKGLRYEVLIPNTTLGNDVAEMVERGDFFESSFIFTVNADGQKWEKDSETGIWVRYISNVSGLYDCTICSYAGAYANTDIEVATRMLKEIVEKEEHREEKVNTEILQVDEDALRKEQEEKENEKFKLDNEIFLLENEIN